MGPKLQYPFIKRRRVSAAEQVNKPKHRIFSRGAVNMSPNRRERKPVRMIRVENISPG